MVSIVIPCYNYGHLISETIKSVLDQTYNDIEIIVINDGSKDNTEAIVNTIAQNDRRVKCYTFFNRGLGASRNEGINIAKGQFVQFLDADDLLEKSKIYEQIKIFEQHPDVDIVYGSVRYFKENPFNPADRLLTYWGENREWMPMFSGKGNSILYKSLNGNFAHLSSALFRKSIVDKVGLFDNEISAVADYHFLLRSVIKNALFYYSDVPGSKSLVRWHPDNMSKDANYMRKEEIKMREKLRPELKFDAKAFAINEQAIKGLNLQVNKSWKTIFMSGGKFEYFKKLIFRLGLDKIARKIFYFSGKSSQPRV